MLVPRTVRLALIVLTALLAIPAASVSAAPRMPIGFYDDPSFRWLGDTAANLEAARQAGSSIIHTTADWSQIAPTRPAFPLDPDSPEYHLSDLDSLVRNAARYGQQVMINISQAPKWANGGRGPNYPPTNLNDISQFAQMLSSRYSGKNPGYGSVNRWSVWNEPNLGLFLLPQYSGNKIVSPGIYARIYKAAYAGIKRGNPLAQVAIGETSNRGRDKPLSPAHDSVAPGTFARMLAAIPGLKFDAYATHPYPTEPFLGPTQQVRWPNVTMTQLTKFGTSLQSWFHRRVPIWITEYGQQTKPQIGHGVTYAKQAAFARQALRMAAANPYVEMFCWFIIRDSPKTWKSGLMTAAGARKPAFATFSSTARLLDGQTIRTPGGRSPLVKLYVPYLTFQNQSGAILGITYRVYSGNSLIAIGQPAAPLSPDESVTFEARFTPVKGKTYRLTADVNDASGNHEIRTVVVVST
jgi:hypothetical protein